MLSIEDYGSDGAIDKVIGSPRGMQKNVGTPFAGSR